MAKRQSEGWEHSHPEAVKVDPKLTATMDKLIQEWTEKHKDDFDNPPCLICKKPSFLFIDGPHIRPNLGTLQEDIDTQYHFALLFPIGMYLCLNHTALEIREWLAKRGVNLEREESANIGVYRILNDLLNEWDKQYSNNAQK